MLTKCPLYCCSVGNVPLAGVDGCSSKQTKGIQEIEHEVIHFIESKENLAMFKI